MVLTERLFTASIAGENKEWDEIAMAYYEVIEKGSQYKELASEIVSAVKNSNKVLDMGCGTGAQLDLLLQENPSCEVVGVDSNPSMLSIALGRLQINHPGKNFRLFIGDAAAFNGDTGFDAAISSNVLFNVEKPMDYLDNAYKLLTPGGRLVLTSPQTLSSMDLAEQMMREDFKRQGIYEEKRPFIDTVWKVNRGFQGRSNVYSAERMRDILLDFIGFDGINAQKELYVSNFFFVAKKEDSPSGMEFKISAEPELIRKGARLRYNWLHDRLNAVPEKEDGIYMDDCDHRAIGSFAVENSHDRVIGFLNYIPPGEKLPFSDMQLVDRLHAEYGPIGACNGFYVVKTRQSGKIGTAILDKLTVYAYDTGVGGLVAETNPAIVKWVESMGWRNVGEIPYSYGGKNVPSVLMFKPTNAKP